MAIPQLRIKIILLLTVMLLSISCSKNNVFSEFKPINEKGWHKDSICEFSFPITDTNVKYNFYVNVRNNNEYSYQNFWIFVNKTYPTGVLTNDTIECYLADQRGKWLGSGVGAVKEMPILYQQKVSFSKPGTYKIKIGHGMRDTLLMGISDIGIRIEKSL